MRQAFLVAGVLPWVLAACTGAPGVSVTTVGEAGRPPRMLDLRVGLVLPDRELQAVVLPYASSDIDHVTVTLWTVNGSGNETATMNAGGAITGTIPGNNLTASIVLHGLNLSTHYRLRGQAFSATDEVISVDAQSLLDFTTSNEDRPAVAALPIQLKNKSFSAEASATLNVIAGGLQDTGTPSVAF